MVKQEILYVCIISDLKHFIDVRYIPCNALLTQWLSGFSRVLSISSTKEKITNTMTSSSNYKNRLKGEIVKYHGISAHAHELDGQLKQNKK